MKMFALRIPEDMKREMRRVKINWAEYIRRSIDEVLKSQKRRTLIERFRRMTEGNKPTPSGTAASLIRQMRDRG